MTSLEECSPLCLNTIATLSLTCEVEQAANARPVQIHVKSSYDGINYDTADKNTFILSSSPAQQVRQTFDVTPNVKYIK